MKPIIRGITTVSHFGIQRVKCVRFAIVLWAASAFVPVAVAQAPAAAREALRNLAARDIPKALETLGEVPASSGDATSAAAGGLHRALAQLDTDEPYEILHKWSMPTASDAGVRVLISLVPETAPPQEFARALGQRPKKESFAVATVGEMPGIFCSAWMMVLAADDAGNLRRLITELEELAAQKIDNAGFVLTLAKVRDRRSSDKGLGALFEARVTVEDKPKPAEIMDDAVLVAAGMTRPSLRPVCVQIVKRLCQFNFANGTSTDGAFLRRLQATVILKNRSPETDGATVLYASPQLWIAAADQNHAGHAAGADRAIWLTHEEHVKRLAGPGDDLLLLRYPLTGTFELKGEVTSLDHGGAGLSYGGLAFDANQHQFTVKDVQRSHFESRNWPFVAPQELRMFNRVNVRSDEEKVTFLSNLHPGWTGTSASCASCPWLGLRALGDGKVFFRNLGLVGEPLIPREVHIAESSDLRGWTATYGERVPKAVQPFMPGAANTGPANTGPANAGLANAGLANAGLANAGPANAGLANAEVLDWHVADGVIHGRMAERAQAGAVDQSHLVYMRPLLDGESVSYEFFYEEGKATVHPALGRLAFLIETGGIRIHWLTDNENEWTGLAADNAVVEPLNRRGPRPLPLNPVAWNTVVLKLTDGKANVSLNGEEVYERPVDEVTNRHIGFYHDRNTSAAQIRNVVLTGDWPEKLSTELMATFLAKTPLFADDEEILAGNVFAVRQRAAALPDAERFEYLADWVLPSQTHGTIRMSGAFMQTDPAPIVKNAAGPDNSPGGALVSPVFDLLTTARQQGRLGELLTSIDAIPDPQSESQQRARYALLPLVHMEMNDMPSALAASDKLHALVAKATPKNLAEMWPETLAVWRGARRFGVNAATSDLLTLIFSQRTARSKPAGTAHWHAHIAALQQQYACLQSGAASEALQARDDAGEWIPAARSLNQTRGMGFPESSWRRDGQQLQHINRHDEDYLFFRSPLLGNFEVEGEVVGRGNFQFLSGGEYCGPNGMSQLQVGTFRSGARVQRMNPSFSQFDAGVRFRVVSRDGVCTTYINGRQVRKLQLREHHDPWIGLRAVDPYLTTLRNVRITGHPEIPDAVAMSAAEDLTGWLNYFNYQQGLAWWFIDDPESSGWILGRPRDELAGTFCEALLRYHRPLAGNDSVEYDFFYQPGKAHTHPASAEIAGQLTPALFPQPLSPERTPSPNRRKSAIAGLQIGHHP